MNTIAKVGLVVGGIYILSKISKSPKKIEDLPDSQGEPTGGGMIGGIPILPIGIPVIPPKSGMDDATLKAKAEAEAKAKAAADLVAAKMKALKDAVGTSVVTPSGGTIGDQLGTSTTSTSGGSTTTSGSPTGTGTNVLGGGNVNTTTVTCPNGQKYTVTLDDISKAGGNASWCIKNNKVGSGMSTKSTGVNFDGTLNTIKRRKAFR